MNSFGHSFRITVFGESHGPVVGVTVDGMPAGIPLCEQDFDADLARRRSDASAGTTPRREPDRPEIVSGLYNGHTDGTPLTLLFRNTTTKPQDYAPLARHPRPSHADLAAARKYGGFNHPGGGGMFSGRMTVALVAAATAAKKLLPGVLFSTTITEIGGIQDPARFDALLTELRTAGDSAGGVVEVRAQGVAAGTGEPFFDSVESLAAHLLFSIPGVKGVEFGAGFGAARSRGSRNNDPIIDRRGTTATNNDGGLNGGIANGNEIVLRVAFKPAPSIAFPQETFDFERDRPAPLTIAGRHDACIALRGAVVAEAALACALADLTLRAGNAVTG